MWHQQLLNVVKYKSDGRCDEKLLPVANYVTLLDTLSFHKPYPEMREF